MTFPSGALSYTAGRGVAPRPVPTVPTAVDARQTVSCLRHPFRLGTSHPTIPNQPAGVDVVKPDVGVHLHGCAAAPGDSR